MSQAVTYTGKVVISRKWRASPHGVLMQLLGKIDNYKWCTQFAYFVQ